MNNQEAPPQTDSISYSERVTGIVYALDFSLWKRPIVQRFFQNADVRFIGKSSKIPSDSTLLTWGRKPVPEHFEQCTLIHLEDGFLRSVGLGADLVQPVSWVADSRGIYYDARCESDLEQVLANYQFSDELIRRAADLRDRIIKSGVTKYNVGAGGWQRPSAQRVILVPGQVENDASIRFGAPVINTNIGLLKAVREANPDAYIVYKPHPDVLAGLRQQDSAHDQAVKHCDEIVTDVAMDALLDAVDEVHLLTSLTGFEALLRDLKVTCYGHPFYAGWGLTHDIVPLERRVRQLKIEQLIAATLILYPTYISRATGRYITAEEALTELEQWRQAGSASGPGIWLKTKRMILGIGAKLRYRSS